MEAVQRQTARVLLVNRRGEVLLLFGRDPARPDAPYWFTIGGAVEPDEVLVDAAVRELHEETGIEIHPDQLIGPIHRGTHAFSFDGHDYVSDSTFFAASVQEVAVTFDGMEEGEVENIFEARWWAPTDLAEGISLSNLSLPAIARLAVDAVNPASSGSVRRSAQRPR